MALTLKHIDAGGIQVAALYNRCTPRDSAAQRAAKHQASSAAQRRMNQIYSYQKLELMLAKNFPTAGSALVVTLTHDDQHMPKDRREAQLRFKYFLQKLRAARKAEGLPEPVVFWAPEILTSASGRWHQHIVLDSTGRDLEILRRCWIYGNDIEAEKLRVDAGKNHETLAKYMTKELRECQEYEAKPGLHGWSCTRSCRLPEVDEQIVDDRKPLRAPRGATVLIQERRSTEFAERALLKYRLPARCFQPRARARRRRR